MSNGTPSASSTTPQPLASGPPKSSEIKLVSHSTLFYWWPVWALAFFMATWTWLEDHRLAIVPSGGTVKAEGPGTYVLNFGDKTPTKSLDRAVNSAGSSDPAFRPRVSEHASLGAIFVIGLILTIVITNVPLRGLWSFITIIMIVVLALIISLIPRGWDEIFESLANLHIYMNLAAYLLLGTAVFVLWALATFIFDRRSYIIFTPGQVKVCEHIGASVEAFGTQGVRLEKQRDDLFRHYILGFGSGDLIVHVQGGREIRLPNVLGIGWRLKAVEDMLRTVATT